MTTPPASDRTARPSVLIFFTHLYPYAKGEEFIEIELPHLARAWDRVIVVATKTRDGDEVTRQVPEGVTVLRAGRQLDDGRLSELRAAARGVRAEVANSSSPGSLLRRKLDLLRQTGGHPMKVAMELAFVGVADEVTTDLVAQLRDHWDDWDLGRAEIDLYAYWLHSSATALLGTAAWLRSRGATVGAQVARGHRYEIFREIATLGHLPQRPELLAGLDGVYVVSEMGARRVRDENPGFAGKVHCQHLGTRDPGPVLTLGREPFTVVSCALMTPVKRLDRIPGIVRRLRDRGIDARWTHIGSGPEEDAVRALGRDLLGEHASFPGYVPNADLVDFYRRLNPSVLVNLSSSEGLPVNLMDGASLGLPLVATNVGGCAEIVHNRDNGFLLDADFTDDDAVAALTVLATEPDEAYRARGARSRQLWAKGFDEAVVYTQFIEQVRALAGR
ncbi:glycosyltransferase [Aestuariimicrobium sp. T2.26MG-19.2B]|uniref:glycosyltransferase n=1 Tax=Aestuariimicrobium sp. T2.26MG-19.2B TaxID=3040679 RepID=UPI002477330C|nr:glycosyltransferase [Aestuariimicrobium sp. T2.26MG-19.2B]CAI9403040.1 hypothetical protein AESSP_00924 [Aestuariimicrobium sp. T2.26MG-19.2B]